MDKKDTPKEDKLSDYFVSGIIGALSGAVGAVMATAFLDKETRKRLGQNLLSVSEKVLEKLNSNQSSKSLPDKPK